MPQEAAAYPLDLAAIIPSALATLYTGVVVAPSVVGLVPTLQGTQARAAPRTAEDNAVPVEVPVLEVELLNAVLDRSQQIAHGRDTQYLHHSVMRIGAARQVDIA